MNDTISLELHRAVVAQHSRSESDLLTTNAALMAHALACNTGK